MRPDERDLAHLWDMREFALDARALTAESNPERFASSRYEQLAVAKAVELVGEAAGRVSVAFRDAHPEVPWSAIVGKRHRLVHDYRRISLKRVWDIVQNDVPPLLEALDALIPEAPPGQDPG